MKEKLKLRTIGLHLPDKSHFHDSSDHMFVSELTKVIRESGRYKLLRLNLKKLLLLSEHDAKTFLQKKGIFMIVEHDSAFYSRNTKYKTNVGLLQKHVPFINSIECQRIAHDKIATKRVLKDKQIPVLDDVLIDSPSSLKANMTEGLLYVAKPHNAGAGSGVRLLKRQGGDVLRHIKGSWKKIELIESNNDGIKHISLKHKQNLFALTTTSIIFVITLVGIFLLPSLASTLLLVLVLMICFYFFIIFYESEFTYKPLLLEPFFNDGETSFSSLRCTVIGDKVVEAVKRTNKENITSNISSGGTAEKIVLTDYQIKIAIDASKAVGAEYSGVDILVRDNESVIDEVNIGPFTLFCKYSGVNVGKIFGEYLIKKCDLLNTEKQF